ncbi:hypothetical protein [Halorussus lipolyticus]|uniref:hypothetical protein n=1 Tax=Halorussus lipolyticus TaxID=3034024 RepID=UPI0023E8F5BB|nr:hypothetical protein [Halorussus sp. DT80]
MRRIWFAVMGGTFLLVGVGFAGAFGLEGTTDPATAIALVLWFSAALLYVLGGLGKSIGGLAWFQFVGLGNVCLGLQLLTQIPVALADGIPGTEALVVTIATGLGGLSLSFIGLDWFRGGRHFDLSAFDDGPSAGPEQSR